MTKSSFYITTPIYYVNDAPHIGHAYTTIACDVMARFMRLDGHEVKFLTGTDEHGQKVDKAAKAAGKDPQEFTDEVSQHFRALVNRGDNILNATNDDFIRTTEPRHKTAAQALWKKIEANGFIYKDTYGGWYAVRDEAYYQESELIEGKAPTGAEVEWVEEESYFFKLSEFEDKLLSLYHENPDFVIPDIRLNEVRSFVEGGLKDLSISRTTFDWGIPVPGDDNHVMYVWIDALTNYLTATGFPDENADDYHTYWLGGDNSPIHVVGKDIIRFHAVYWPAFLMAADVPLPKHIVAHGWWTIEGEKMSKSLGNVLSPQEMITCAGGVDQLRYYMLRAMPFGNDGDFSKQRLIETVNADLANNIGNLAQRTLSMIQKNCEGTIPEHADFNAAPGHGLEEEDSQLLITSYALHLQNLLRQSMSRMQFADAIKAIIDVANAANEYIDKQAPWVLKKENPARMKTVLYTLAETIRCIAIALQPFMPQSADKILDQLAISKEKRLIEHISADTALKPGTVLPKPEGVFPRLEWDDEQKGAA